MDGKLILWFSFHKGGNRKQHSCSTKSITCTKSLICPQNLVINSASNSFCIANLALLFTMKTNKDFVVEEEHLKPILSP